MSVVATEQILTTDTGPLAYHLLGAGPPRVAVLPGWGMNVPFLRTTATWAVWQAWAAAHPLLFLDRRGTGASRPNTGDAGPEQLAADLVTALDGAGAGAVAVWAHADAALAAVALAAHGGGRVERLVLQAPFARLLAAPDAPAGLPPEAVLALAMLTPAAPLLGELERLGRAPGVETDGLTRLRESLAAGLLPRLLNDLAAIDARPILPAVTAPTLVLHGAGDGVIPPAAGAAVARLIPGARVEIIPDMAHLPSPDHLATLHAYAGSFLAR